MRVKSVLRVAVASTFVAAGLLIGGQLVRSDVVRQAAAATPCNGYAVLLAHSDGSVTEDSPTGGACPAPAFDGSLSGKPLNAPIVGMVTAPGGTGYWLVGADGGVFTFGDTQFYGSTGNLHLNAPVVGMAATPDGRGYWLVAADGGVFTFGDAAFYGSTGNLQLNAPIVGMATDGATGGYWLVGSDGGVFAFHAPFLGSLGGRNLNAPLRFITGTPDFGGYRMVGADGGVFDFGDAQFYGSAANEGSQGWEALAPTPDGMGYWLFENSSGDGVTFSPFGDASSALAPSGGNQSAASIVGAAIYFVPSVPTISTNPNSATVAPGATASFYASAVGPPPPTAQWQLSTDAGKEYVNIAGATSTTLSFTTAQSQSGYMYRAVFTNSAGSGVSTAATLTVGAPPNVTAEPQNQTVASGANATFSADGGGDPTPTVQWSMSTNDGTSYTDVSGATSKTLKVATTTADSGNLYRAVFTNTYGTATTDSAVLTVIPAGDVLPSSAEGYFADVSCLTATACVAVGGTEDAKALIETTTSGQGSFMTQPVPTAAPAMESVDCASAKFCLAVGGNDALVTTDEGAEWSLNAAPASADDLSGVACETTSLCVAVGSKTVSGTLTPVYIYSTDGGTDWSNATPPATTDLSESVSCSATVCLAVGQGTARSTDGGMTWTYVHFGSVPSTGVACTTNASTCLTVGPTADAFSNSTLTGQLGLSTDDGTAWTNDAGTLPASTATTQTVACGGTSDCLLIGPSDSASGDPLVVLYTPNSGLGWLLYSGPSGFVSPSGSGTFPYPAVTCTNASDCVVVGAGSSGPLADFTGNDGSTWVSGSVQ